MASAAQSLHGPPCPGVHDEFSYLLAADTFAAGRLTNPPHPFWQHFETIHVIQQPTYMSKYPPGQGLVLALGQRLGGYPIVGAWIGIGAACAAICWMLQGWLRPSRTLAGGLLAVAWLASSYWSYTYWGGSVAACGGALVYGALPRIVRQRRWQAAVFLGLGLAMLMCSRPYEGLVASVPAVAVLAVWLVRQDPRTGAAQAARVAAATLLVLGPAAVWLGYYHAAVTGDPLRMPYGVHDATYAASPTFLWQSLGPVPTYRHPEMANYYAGWERPRFERKHVWWGLNRSVGTKLWGFLQFYTGVGIFLLPLAALWRGCHDRWMWLAAAACWLVFLALTQTLYLSNHYLAPVAALVVVQAAAGLPRLRAWRWRGRRTGRWLVAAMVVICQGAYGISLHTAWRRGASPMQRTQMLHHLEASGGRHLVFVRYAPGHDCHREWVYNRADIDGTAVVWAREISPSDDRRLREYFADRSVWLVAADAQPPQLVPYDSASAAAYPRRPRAE